MPLFPPNLNYFRLSFRLCNIYRRFIDNFSKLAGPLNELLKKNKHEKFTLEKKQTEAFRTLIDKILSPPILVLPRPDLPYSVDTDTSDYGIGCALFQTHESDNRRPILFWSRSLNAAERNYSATERECLAVVWSLKTLRPYLIFESFTVHTDHQALKLLLSIHDLSGRLMRWRLCLPEFDFEVSYKKGKLNQQADALSRLHTLAETVPSDPAQLREGFPLRIRNNVIQELTNTTPATTPTQH